MPKSLHNRLLEKGWSEEDIKKTLDIVSSGENKFKNVEFAIASHPIIYWVGLIVAILGNLLLAVTLIPFLMFLKSLQVYIILGIIGMVFGALFNHILKDIEQTDESHHVVAGVFIPALALITVYVMISVANHFNDLINNSNTHNAIILSGVYVLCFSTPYLIYKIKDLMTHKKEKSGPKDFFPQAKHL